MAAPGPGPRSRVSFEIHRRFLRRNVPDGCDVLEIGAGPGRFTIVLAQMACGVVVSDISPVQLAANETHVTESGLEGAVVERRLLDVCDLSSVPDGSFDAVVAYGGPLSYAFDAAESALAEMLRIVRPKLRGKQPTSAFSPDRVEIGCVGAIFTRPQATGAADEENSLPPSRADVDQAADTIFIGSGRARKERMRP